MKLTEKSAYVKGLMEGMQLSNETNEGKVLYAVVDLLADLSEKVQNLQENAVAVSDELDEIEEVLDGLEECIDELYDDDDIYDFSSDDEDDDYDFDDENPEYEVTCPKCGEVVVVDEDTLLEGETSCPKCGESLEFEFDEIEP